MNYQNFIFIICLLAAPVHAQIFGPSVTAYSRGLLRKTTASAARTYLGLSGGTTNFWSSAGGVLYPDPQVDSLSITNSVADGGVAMDFNTAVLQTTGTLVRFRNLNTNAFSLIAAGTATYELHFQGNGDDNNAVTFGASADGGNSNWIKLFSDTNLVFQAIDTGVTTAGTITTGNPTVGPSAAWKLGDTNASTTGVNVDIGGEARVISLGPNLWSSDGTTIAPNPDVENFLISQGALTNQIKLASVVGHPEIDIGLAGKDPGIRIKWDYDDGGDLTIRDQNGVATFSSQSSGISTIDPGGGAGVLKIGKWAGELTITPNLTNSVKLNVDGTNYWFIVANESP